jgi:vancomycin resistance protein YoaR
LKFPNRKIRIVTISTISVGSLSLIWLVAWLAVGSGVPSGVSVSGIDIGGRTKANAMSDLKLQMDKMIKSKINLTAKAASISISPKSAGISVDLIATLGEVPQRTLNPINLFSLLTSKTDLKPVINIDKEKFIKALRPLEIRTTKSPRDATIVYKELEPQVLSSLGGVEIDRKKAIKKVSKYWLKKNVIDLPMKKVKPKASAKDATALLEFARQAVSGSLTINIAGQPIVITPTEIAGSLAFRTSASGDLAPIWVKESFIQQVGSRWSKYVREPINASFVMVEGQARVQPSTDGSDVPDSKLNEAIIPALSKIGVLRAASVTPEVVKAKVTTEMAGGLGIKDVIGTFTTNYPYAEYRLINIHRAALWMDGTIVQPGEIFSYNKAVGERTEARGFVPGIMIDNGVFKKDLGGGVSQVATTTWNAAWFSGLELVQHKPHSFYISRYPAGRESTVAWPNVDVKFKNNSGHPIFVDTSFTKSSVTVSIYGTKFVDVESESGPKTNFVEHEIYEEDSIDCIFQAGVDGFSITVDRILKKDGIEFKREKYRTRYIPEDHVICTNPEAKWMNPPLKVQRGEGN